MARSALSLGPARCGGRRLWHRRLLTTTRPTYRRERGQRWGLYVLTTPSYVSCPTIFHAKLRLLNNLVHGVLKRARQLGLN